MSEDLPIIITSVYTLADGQTDALNSSQNRQHGTQKGFGEFSHDFNEHRSTAPYSWVEETGKTISNENCASLKENKVTSHTTCNGSCGDKDNPTRILPETESHLSLADLNESNLDSVRTPGGPYFCPSFCCRKNVTLVEKLRAKSKYTRVEQKPIALKPAACTVFSKSSINNKTQAVMDVIETRSSEFKSPSAVGESSALSLEEFKPETHHVSISAETFRDSIQVTSNNEIQTTELPCRKKSKEVRNQDIDTRKKESSQRGNIFSVGRHNYEAQIMSSERFERTFDHAKTYPSSENTEIGLESQEEFGRISKSTDDQRSEQGIQDQESRQSPWSARIFKLKEKLLQQEAIVNSLPRLKR